MERKKKKKEEDEGRLFEDCGRLFIYVFYCIES